jgi:hypothetical protein
MSDGKWKIHLSFTIYHLPIPVPQSPVLTGNGQRETGNLLLHFAGCAQARSNRVRNQQGIFAIANVVNFGNF